MTNIIKITDNESPELEHVKGSVGISDSITLSDGRHTKNGYYTTEAKIARTGIQVYTGRELRKTEIGDRSFYRVYRPESEVFAEDSIKSFANIPVTNNHPCEDVVAENWKQYSVGNTGNEIMRDGAFIKVPLILMDMAAISDVESGKRELSVGYDCDIIFNAGFTDGGEPYDAIQTNIRANHLAIVDRGRAGSECRISDGKGSKMKKVKLILNDGNFIEIEVAETAANHIESMVSTIKDAVASIDAKAGEIAVLKASLETAKTAVTDSVLDATALDALVAARSVLRDNARLLIGDSVSIDGKTDAEIRALAVTIKLGDEHGKKGEAFIAAAFETLVALNTKDKTHTDPLRNILLDSKVSTSTIDAAITKSNNKLTNAWKDNV